MKKETKELVEFIKSAMNCVKEEAEKQNAQSSWWFTQYDKALEFLNSLPEIESHLCRGGYIQDKNGTPCCDGDKVKFKIKECCPLYFNNHILDYSEERIGYLQWLDFEGRFHIIYEEKQSEYISDTIFLSLGKISEFEKVKE